MTLHEVDRLVYKMLAFRDEYMNNLGHLVFQKVLNYGLNLLKVKTLLFQPDSWFDGSRDEEIKALEDSRYIENQNCRTKTLDSFFKFPPNFYQRFDMSSRKLDRDSL